MQKVLLICPAHPSDMPYLRQYIDYFDSLNILYDITFLCENGEDVDHPDNYYPFVYSSYSQLGLYRKLYNYYCYSRFVIKRMLKKHYTHVVTMGIACSVFLAKFLSSRFKSKYIYDIRDYSQILRVPFFRYANSILLKHSFMNVISSAGFKHWLPTGIKYTLCHNITKDKLDDGHCLVSGVHISEPIRILTIGQVRDFETNTSIIEQLSNNNLYELIFSGKGVTLEYLEKLVEERGYSNVTFTGRYKKDEEDAIVEAATFLNVCMGDSMISNYLLSNRLYLAARLKRPLISFDDCYQAEIIQKYNLGMVIKRSDVLSEKIKEYVICFDSELFINGCNTFLNKVKSELKLFSNMMEEFAMDINKM